MLINLSPIDKDQMYSGEWTLVIMDNNGVNPSFTSERIFYLDVAPQVTKTYTPTIAVPYTTTPSTTSTSWSTETDTITLPQSTVTSNYKQGHSNTVTITHSMLTNYITTWYSYTRTLRTWTKTIATVTKTASCTIPPKATKADPSASQAILALITSTLSAEPSTAAKRDVPARRRTLLPNLSDTVRQRLKRSLRKRGPDSPTSTVTDLNTADWQTETVTTTAPTVTLTAFCKLR